MSLTSFILLSVCTGLIVEALVARRDLFSPIRIWLVLWSFIVGITDLKLSYHQTSWQTMTWLTLGLAILLFVLGACIANMMFVGRAKIHKREILLEGRLFGVILALSIIFGLTFLIETAVAAHGIPAFSAVPELARNEVGIFAIHLFIEAYIVICVLSFLFIIKVKHHRSKSIIIAVCLLLTTVLYLLLLNRLNMFIVFLLITLLFNYMVRRISLQHILWSAALFAAFFVGVGQIRSSTKGFVENYLYAISKMKISQDYALATGPYMYVAMNVENFDRGLDKLKEHTYGAKSLDFLLASVGLKHYLAEDIPDNRDFSVYPVYNTFPIFWYFYWDFNLYGVIFGTFLLGWVISHHYNRLKTAPSTKQTVIYSFLLLIVLLSFFTALFARLSYVFCFALLILVMNYVIKYER